MQRLFLPFLFIFGSALLLTSGLYRLGLALADEPFRWFYYQSLNAQGTHEIYRLQPELQRQQDLMAAKPSQAHFYSLSPDEKWLIFSLRDATTKRQSLYRLSTDADYWEVLAPTPDQDDKIIAWTGDWLSFERFGADTTTIYRLRMADTKPQKVLDLPAQDYVYQWTPDGNWLLWQRWGDATIWHALHLPSGQQHQLAADLPKSSFLQLASDSQALYLQAADDGRYALYRVTLADAQSLQLTPYIESLYAFLGDSGDGQWLYYRIVDENPALVYRMATNGTMQTTIDDPTPIYNLAFFPTTTWGIATAYDGDGQDAGIYRMQNDGQDLSLISNTTGYRWLPNHAGVVVTNEDAFTILDKTGTTRRLPVQRSIIKHDWKTLGDWIIYRSRTETYRLNWQTGADLRFETDIPPYQFFHQELYQTALPDMAGLGGIILVGLSIFFVYSLH